MRPSTAIDEKREIVRATVCRYRTANPRVFGSVLKGSDAEGSDLDLLVEMETGASLFGVAGFCYETEKLLGIRVDVVPASVLPGVQDREFVKRIQKQAVAL